MKKVWKGALIGGIVGLILSLFLIKFGSSESIFHQPLDVFLNFICKLSTCSDVTGFILFSIIFTIIFYTLIGVLVGIIVTRFIYKKTYFLILILVLTLYPVHAYVYEYSPDNHDFSKLNISTAIKVENMTFNESFMNKSDEGRFTAQYNNQWDNHLLDGPWKINENEEWIPLLLGVMQSSQELNNIYFFDANDGDEIIAYTGWD